MTNALLRVGQARTGGWMVTSGHHMGLPASRKSNRAYGHRDAKGATDVPT
jgi:hypothetical protein